MKIKSIILIALYNFQVWGSIPTTESLFRNNNNSDVQSSLVMVTLQAERKLNEKSLEQPITETKIPEKEVLTDKPLENSKLNIKFLFSVNESENVECIRVFYKPGKMDDDNILDVKYYSNLSEAISTNSELKGLMLGLMSTLALNRSEEISTFLKKFSQNYKSNEQLIDPDKRDLYKKYKKYLKLIKEDESLKESLENPMDPKDSEVKKTVNLIKEKPFFQKDPNVTLEKKNNDFYWKVDLDILDAVFDGRTQRLEKIEYEKSNTKINISLDNYILFNGNNELPKMIKLDTPVHTYILRTSSHVQLNIGTKSMVTRYNEYKKKAEEVNKQKIEDFFIL